MVVADVYIGTRIPAALNARLEAIALREHNRVSAVIRRLLSDGIERDDQARKHARAPRRNRTNRNAPEAA